LTAYSQSAKEIEQEQELKTQEEETKKWAERDKERQSEFAAERKKDRKLAWEGKDQARNHDNGGDQ
jgi:hypothetical protein